MVKGIKTGEKTADLKSIIEKEVSMRIWLMKM